MNETNAGGSGSARSAEIVPFRITIPEGLKDMTYASWRPSPRRPPPSGTVEASGRNPSRRGRGRSHPPRPPDVHRRAGGPCWARPALWAVLVPATALYAWNLSSLSGNTFHNAAIYSGTQSWKAFSFGALTCVRGANNLPIPVHSGCGLPAAPGPRSGPNVRGASVRVTLEVTVRAALRWR